MDSAQLLSIMEKDGRTTMKEVIGSHWSDIKIIAQHSAQPKVTQTEILLFFDRLMH